MLLNFKLSKKELGSKFSVVPLNLFLSNVSLFLKFFFSIFFLINLSLRFLLNVFSLILTIILELLLEISSVLTLLILR